MILLLYCRKVVIRRNVSLSEVLMRSLMRKNLIIVKMNRRSL